MNVVCLNYAEIMLAALLQWIRKGWACISFLSLHIHCFPSCCSFPKFDSVYLFTKTVLPRYIMFWFSILNENQRNTFTPCCELYKAGGFLLLVAACNITKNKTLNTMLCYIIYIMFLYIFIFCHKYFKYINLNILICLMDL